MEEERIAEAQIAAVRGKKLTRKERGKLACDLCSSLLALTLKKSDAKEKKHLATLAKMMEDPKGRAFTTAMTDQCFRSRRSCRTANQIVYLLQTWGIPRYLPWIDRIKLFVFQHLARFFPFILVPLAQRNLRKELSNVILPEDPKELEAFFKQSKAKGIQININHLGEAILGEQEAKRRLTIYLHDLKNPLVEYISVKISTIYSQINPLAFEETLETLSARLRELYIAAQNNHYTDASGKKRAKFVNLDMEEYKDLDFTKELFKKVLLEERFLNLEAGIVLQSYVPDSFEVQKELTTFAKKRVEQGGAPIKIRIVKGANLEMESVESSIRRWDLPTFNEKNEADANFKRMVEYGVNSANAPFVHIGIGSHNLFDISYCLLLRAEEGVEKEVSFEMLAGMAEPMQRAVHAVSGSLLLYCPEAKAEAFQNAVAYLIRRLDENTGPKNFLRYLFSITPNSVDFHTQKDFFLQSCEAAETPPAKRLRTQNRLLPPEEHAKDAPFKNEPDSDFSLKENREWATSIFATWQEKDHEEIPCVIGEERHSPCVAEGFDPSRPGKVLYKYALADCELADKALKVATEEQSLFGNTSIAERSKLLATAAQKIREQRGALIGAMIGDGGKLFTEADVEVSEAVDFCEYYRRTFEKITTFKEVTWRPKGPILVAPPWNFPLAIPVGGIAAALMAGNTVLFKPAPETVLIGWHIANLFWEAGVSKKALQFFPCQDDPVGSHIIESPLLKGVILTGATATAKHLLSLNPALDLMAETGGKNALIATSLCDRDLAVKDAVHSAFFHAGQKCSACSLLILEKELYNCPLFLQQLKDAAMSLAVGSAWDKTTLITPLIHPPKGPLARALTTLDKGEEWVLEPKADPNNPALFSPGIKRGVKRGSFSHQTEFFGPVLSIMCANNLEEAIEIANDTPYGLTSGIHSLDVREQKLWKEKIVAGNLYINRGITGAIVRRQPFGGCKASSFGAGAKAGGPNYVIELCHPKEEALPQIAPAPLPDFVNNFSLTDSEKKTLAISLASYNHFAPLLTIPLDPTGLIGQDNFFYHVPRENILCRFNKKDTTLDLLKVYFACKATKTPLCISTEVPLASLPGVHIRQEKEEALIACIENEKPSRLRLLSPPSTPLVQGAAQAGTTLLFEPPLAHGRFELLHYLREVSLSHDYHRYGHLGLKQ